MLGVVVRRKTEAQLKKEAKERAAKALRRTKERYGLGEPAGLKGVVVSPLHAEGERRKSTIAAHFRPDTGFGLIIELAP